MVETTIKRLIRDVPDFPKPGILFKDVTPLLADAAALSRVVDALAEPYRQGGAPTVDRVLGIESRGFIFGTPVAQRLGVGFAPIRKPGKLPWRTVSESYALEYGEDRIELHEDAVHKGERVLIVDDLLATGGTLTAACRLVERLGGQVAGCAVVIELGFLDGRKRLGERPVHSLVTY
ncbi:MAG: adenine phosphoribosyltransferase [Planctomycetes bacterium]|nr:adenine phosphoribosyltransferase [Planctomycetota bacterium]